MATITTRRRANWHALVSFDCVLLVVEVCLHSWWKKKEGGRAYAECSLLYYADEGKISWVAASELILTPISLTYTPQQTVLCALNRVSSAGLGSVW